MKNDENETDRIKEKDEKRNTREETKKGSQDEANRNVVVFCSGFRRDLCDEADLVKLAMKKKFTRFFCSKRKSYAIQIVAPTATAYFIRDLLKEVKQWGKYRLPLYVGVCSWDYASIFSAAPGWYWILQFSCK